MWIDERTEFADNVSVAASAGTALIGDVIDTSVARDLGNGQPVYVVIRTGSTEIITGGSAGTLQFKVCSDAAAAIATDGSATEHIVTDTFVTDDAAANSALFNAGGTIFVGTLPQKVLLTKSSWVFWRLRPRLRRLLVQLMLSLLPIWWDGNHMQTQLTRLR